MAAVRSIRFGVIAESARTFDDLLATARRAEGLGYSTLLIRDHFVSDPFGAQLAPLPALAAVAATTERLRLGTLVLDNDYRHPVVLAKEAATLDAISKGRFELGLGAGWLRDEYERAGLPFDRPGVRVGRLEESLRVIKGLLSEQSLTFSGEHYSVNDLENFPRPAQEPRPPILVGAGGNRMLRLAGREADIVGILPIALPNGTISEALVERSSEAIARKVGLVREAAAARNADVELSMVITVTLSNDHRGAAERIAVERGWGASAAEHVLEMPSQFIGTVDRIAEEMLARRECFGFSYFVVSDLDMEALGGVVTRLSGT